MPLLLDYVPYNWVSKRWVDGHSIAIELDPSFTESECIINKSLLTSCHVRQNWETKMDRKIINWRCRDNTTVKKYFVLIRQFSPDENFTDRRESIPDRRESIRDRRESIPEADSREDSPDADSREGIPETDTGEGTPETNRIL